MGARDFTWTSRIYYEDTDASGVVYHARYLQFFERARTEWLRQFEASQQKLRERESVVFTVANIEVDFVSPARLDDEVDISVTIAESRRASMRVSQQMLRRHDAAVLARARVRVGCVDVQTFRPRPLPGFLKFHSLSSGVSA